MEDEIFDEFISGGYKHVKCLVLDHSTSITSEIKNLEFSELKYIMIMPGFSQFEELAILTENNQGIKTIEVGDQNCIHFFEAPVSIPTYIFGYLNTPSLQDLKVYQGIGFKSIVAILSKFPNLKDFTVYLNNRADDDFDDKDTIKSLLPFSSNVERIRIRIITRDNRLGMFFGDPKSFPQLEFVAMYSYGYEVVPFFNRAAIGPEYISKTLGRMVMDQVTINLLSSNWNQAS
ncbi:hypothetical protein H4219_002862 [Mycoemilia scoparia]|uniref:Uncharacterized protein n=1 Tax=Mycoemilia scoparia TaxID=417184 RepID=A0A9W8DNL1_9FUNG|nr:hypothetical protein H4219_002862 [Mycoemilia scoparia]